MRSTGGNITAAELREYLACDFASGNCPIYHPTIFEVPGYIYPDDIIANDDGSALVPYYDSGTTKLFRIDTASTYQPSVQT
jgi:hypothetical protein